MTAFTYFVNLYQRMFPHWFLGVREEKTETSLWEKHIDGLPSSAGPLDQGRVGEKPETKACAPNQKQTQDPLVLRLTLYPLSQAG